MSTGGTSRNRRRRGRRGRREAQQQHHQQNSQVTQPQPEAPTEAGVESPAPPRQRAAESRGAGGDQQDGSRGGSRNRRSRTTKRPTLSIQPVEVLKERVRDLPATGRMTMRTLDDFETGGGMTFGCPMLTRTRMGMPFAEGRRMPRCSMGWALHDEEEASFCMRTPDLLDCWKEHPEREAELRGSNESENAAD